jgi:hypothetical protein
VFREDEALGTETILERLHNLEESPWADLRGKPLDSRGLAYRLKQYGVKSTKVKIAGDSVRGYRRHSTAEDPGPDLHDAWNRYLAPPTEDEEPTEPTEPTVSDPPPKVPEVPLPAGGRTDTADRLDWAGLADAWHEDRDRTLSESDVLDRLVADLGAEVVEERRA